MSLTNRMYMTLYPNNALIASQLEPEQFAHHYTSGSSRHFQGKVIFAEIDPSFRNDFFPIEAVMKELVPHEDGSPKNTKFIASYRVLEHIDSDYIKKLYLVTPDGDCLGLEAGEPHTSHAQDKIRLFAEITPMRMMVLSKLDFEKFGGYITDPNERKSAPHQFYTQLEVNLPEFVEKFEGNPFTPSPIRTLHPSTLRDGFVDLDTHGDKNNKGVALSSNLESFSYALIRHGFMFASKGKYKFFPMPSLSKIEDINYKFWRNM